MAKGSGRPGGNPDLKSHQFIKPEGLKIPRDKSYGITVELEVHSALKLADKERIRAAIVRSLIDQGIPLSSDIVNYYNSKEL